MDTWDPRTVVNGETDSYPFMELKDATIHRMFPLPGGRIAFAVNPAILAHTPPEPAISKELFRRHAGRVQTRLELVAYRLIVLQEGYTAPEEEGQPQVRITWWNRLRSLFCCCRR